MANKSDPFPNLPRRMMFQLDEAKVVKLKWPDGRALEAGDLKQGQIAYISPDGTVRTKRDRKAYMREYMAKKRAKAKT